MNTGHCYRVARRVGVRVLIGIGLVAAAAPAVAARHFPVRVEIVARSFQRGALPVEIDPQEVAALPRAGSFLLESFPLELGRFADLEVEPVDTVGLSASAVVVDSKGSEYLIPTNAARIYTGHVAGAKTESLVFLSFSDGGTYGWVELDGRRFVVTTGAPTGSRRAVVYDPEEIDPESIKWSPFECEADLIPQPFAGSSPDSLGAGAGTCRVVDLAIETDYEFLNLFGGDTAAAQAYIETLVASASVIYRRDVEIQFRLVFSRLWSTPSDPWDAVSTSPQLHQLRSWWLANMTSVSRDLTHMLSGRALGGGVAWVGTVCDSSLGFAVSANLNGFFPTPLEDHSYQNWDIVVFSHELGHNCGTLHTHDGYDPPLDGCGLGDCSNASNGTIMSYCHLCSGSQSNMSLKFHPAVQLKIEGYMASRPCLDDAVCSPCGDNICDVAGGEDDIGCPSDCGCEASLCGSPAASGCFCDAGCTERGDCCLDACSQCGACVPGTTTTTTTTTTSTTTTIPPSETVILDGPSVKSSCENSPVGAATLADVTVAPGNERLLVVAIGGEQVPADCDPSSAMVSYGGTALTFNVEGKTTEETFTTCAGLFTLSAPVVGTADVEVMWPGVVNGVHIAAMAFRNARSDIGPVLGDGDWPEDGEHTVANQIGAMPAGSVVVDIFTSGTDLFEPAAGPEQSQLWKESCPTVFGAGSVSPVIAPGQQTMQWTTAQIVNRYAHALLVVQPADVVPGTTTTTTTTTTSTTTTSTTTLSDGQIEIDASSIRSVCGGEPGDTLVIPDVPVGGQANRALIVTVGAEEGDADCDLGHADASVTYAGLTLTKAVTTVSDTSGWRACNGIFYLLSPPPGTADVAVTFPSNAGDQIDSRHAGAVVLYNVEQQEPEATESNGANATTNPVNTNVTTLADNAWVVDVFSQGNVGVASTTQADQVGRWQESCDTSGSATSTQEVPTAGVTTVGWDYTRPRRYAHSVMVVAPAAGGPPSTTTTTTMPASGTVVLDHQSLTSTCDGGPVASKTLSDVSISPGDDRLLVVAIGGERNPGDCDPSSAIVTYGGTPLTFNIEAKTSEIWFTTCTGLFTLPSPPVGTADVTVTWPDIVNSVHVAAMAFRNAMGDIDTVVGDGDWPDPGDETVTNQISAGSAGSMVVDIFSAHTDDLEPTPGPGQVERWKETCPTLYSVGSTRVATLAGQQTMQWTTPELVDRYAHALMVIQPADVTVTTTTTTTTTTLPVTTTTMVEPPTTTTTLPVTTTTVVEPPTTTTTLLVTTTTTLPPAGDVDNDGLEGGIDPCPTDPRNRCAGVVAVDGTTGNEIRVNANASSAECAGDKTDCNGEMWYADFGYNQAAKAATCNLGGGGESCVISGIVTLFGCEDEATEDLFQCEHADKNPSPELIYSFDVPNGTYVVNLFFANTYDGTAEVGTRLFDIVVEGVVGYASFDQVAAAGGSGIAVVRSAVAVVGDGNGLQIELTNLPVNNPAIKAIEVLTFDDG